MMGCKRKADEKDEGANYSPGKAKYNPTEDAFWKQGDSVPYLALAKTFEAIENISGRLVFMNFCAQTVSKYSIAVKIVSLSDQIQSELFVAWQASLKFRSIFNSLQFIIIVNVYNEALTNHGGL